MQVFVRKKKSGCIFAKKPDADPNGALVEIINSIPSSQTAIGECSHRSEVLFIQVAISPTGDLAVAADIHGNLFTFDFTRNKFSTVKHLSLPASCISIAMDSKPYIIVALSDYSLRIFNTVTNLQVACLRGHSSSITNISIHESMRYALTTSSETAFLWNLDTLTRKRKLSINKAIDLLMARFIPNSNSIMTCFKDNSILIWDAESMTLLHELKSSLAYNVTYRSFTCNSDGSSIAAAGKSSAVHIWDVTSARIVKVLQMTTEAKSIKQVSFLAQHLYPEELVAVVCSNGTLKIIDIKNSVEVWNFGSYEHKVTHFAAASNSGKLLCLMDSGNIVVCDLEFALKSALEEKKDQSREDASVGKSEAKVTRVQQRQSNRMKDVISHRIENSQTLNRMKLKEILKEYGEFPEKYRSFIWKTILQLPENFEAYSTLLEKGIHPAYVDLHKVYPIRSLKLLRVFQRLLSAITYWAPVACECTFIPTLAFPFAKLLQNNQLNAFEVVACVLLNWCQNWFDFIPNPPLSILSLIENVLAYHDRELFQHFIKYRVTTQTYAWTVLQTGFSEVFPRSDWMKLWDHVLMNQPSWMLMAAVAYTLVNRGPLLDCYELESFKQFYRHHNGTGVATVIKETYRLMRTTPNDLDPQKSLQFFTPLLQGQYQLLAKFPQRIKNFPRNEIDRIRKEQIDLLRQSGDLARWRKS